MINNKKIEETHRAVLYTSEKIYIKWNWINNFLLERVGQDSIFLHLDGGKKKNYVSEYQRSATRNVASIRRGCLHC